MDKRESSSGRDRETEDLLRAVAKAVRPFKAGSLGKVSLAHLLVYLERHALSGSLWIYDEGQDSTLQFARGAPAKVKTTLQVPHLGALLVELGYIDQRSHDETITFALRGGGLHGAMLVACNLLDAAGLEAGLREQTALRLIEVFRHVGPTSRFAFYRDVDLLASWGGRELTPVDPWWVLWWGTRQRRNDATVQAALALLGDDRLMLPPNVDWSRFGFGEAERELLAWWASQPASVGTLKSYRYLPQDLIGNLVFVLFLTRNLSYEEAESTSVRPVPDHDVRAPMESVTQLLPRPPLVEPRINEDTRPLVSMPDITIETGAPSFTDNRAPSAPDIEIPVTFDDVESAAQAATPRAPAFAPSQVQEVAPAEAETSTHATKRMAQAFQTLLDPVEQQAEEEPPPPRGPTFSELDLARSAEAMQWSSRANEALREGDIDHAEKYASKALELLPNNAVVKTDYAWAASLLPARRKIGDMGDLLDLLREATQADPALDRPYFVRGTIYEYLGMYEKAYAEFRAAFARNAHNAEAAAKIQEYVRRYKQTGSVDPDSGNDSPPRPSGGVGIPAKAGAMFAKLWKRS